MNQQPADEQEITDQAGGGNVVIKMQEPDERFIPI
jgi:hypothetical protein